MSQSPQKAPGDLSARFQSILSICALCAHAKSHHEHIYFLGMQSCFLSQWVCTCGLGIDKQIYWGALWLWSCGHEYCKIVCKIILPGVQSANYLWWPIWNCLFCSCVSLNVYTKKNRIAFSVSTFSKGTKIWALGSSILTEAFHTELWKPVSCRMAQKL